MKRMLLLLLAAVALLAQTGESPAFKRLGEGDLPVIHTQKGFSTLIEFPADQKIADVTCGDKDFWVIEGTGRFLHVKPAKDNIVTNLNVVMQNDVVYAFILREGSGPGGSKGTADLRVTVNPGDDPAKLRLELATSVQKYELLRQDLAAANKNYDTAWKAIFAKQKDVDDLTAKYQAAQEELKKRTATPEFIRPTCPQVPVNAPPSRMPPVRANQGSAPKYYRPLN